MQLKQLYHILACNIYRFLGWLCDRILDYLMKLAEMLSEKQIWWVFDNLHISPRHSKEYPQHTLAIRMNAHLICFSL